MSANAVAQMLGGAKVIGRTLSTDAEFIAAVRKGLPVRALDAITADLAQAHISQLEVYKLVGSGRTLQRKRAANSALSPVESDRLARLARVLVRARKAIGDATRSRLWLAEPNRSLNGERPIDLLDSDTGTTAVERVLGRIEHGVFS